MQKDPKKPALKGIILRAGFLFLSSFFIVLILWIQVKDAYGYAITRVTSELILLVKDVQFEKIASEKGLVWATFSRPITHETDILLDVPVKTSSYTFNVPLTLGMMTALFPFIRKRWRAGAEAFLLLLGIHFLYVFSLELHGLTTVLLQKGLETAGKAHLLFLQFFWEFIHNMVIRFEPFLIGAYLFIRYKR